MERIDLIVNILSVAVAVVVFFITSAQAKRATVEQTEQENVRATLTDFANLRREHQGFDVICEEHPERRTEVLKAYLGDLERFAVGCNRGAYDLSVVNEMSGGILVGQYRQYFREFINERRRLNKLTSAVVTEALYKEYVIMMKRLHEMRGEAWADVDPIPEDQHVLERFLNMPLSSTDTVFETFKTLPGAMEVRGEGKQGFLYIPGSREDRCVLVAHADTVFDDEYAERTDDEKGDTGLPAETEVSSASAHDSDGVSEATNTVVFENGRYHGTNPRCSIGADDRAGCAILWVMRNSGHSLLILDGEEKGQIGARFLREENPQIFQELNEHTFMIQFDRRGSSDYKTYEIPVSKEFVAFVEKNTGYHLATGSGKTDIQVLCESVCGVNLSVGYYGEHTPDEELVLDEWLRTLRIVQDMTGKKLTRYPTLRSAL